MLHSATECESYHVPSHSKEAYLKCTPVKHGIQWQVIHYSVWTPCEKTCPPVRLQKQHKNYSISSYSTIYNIVKAMGGDANSIINVMHAYIYCREKIHAMVSSEEKKEIKYSATEQESKKSNFSV